MNLFSYNLVVIECGKGTYDTLTDTDDLEVLGSHGWVDYKENTGGKISLLTNGTLLYEKLVASYAENQSIGWQDSKLQNEKLRISGWLKLSEEVIPNNDFGIKVCDISHNEIIVSCKEGEWCYFTVVETCGSAGNAGNQVLLIFDGIEKAISIHIFHLKMELLSCGKSVNICFISFITIITFILQGLRIVLPYIIRQANMHNEKNMKRYTVLEKYTILL